MRYPLVFLLGLVVGCGSTDSYRPARAPPPVEQESEQPSIEPQTTITPPEETTTPEPEKISVPDDTKDILNALSRIPIIRFEKLFEIDYCKAYHVKVGEPDLLLQEVYDPRAITLLNYANEAMNGNPEHLDSIIDDLHRMKLGVTYMGTYGGVPTVLSTADHERPFLRVVRVLQQLKEECKEYPAITEQRQDELAQLTTSLNTSRFPDIVIARIDSIRRELDDGFEFSRLDLLETQLDYFCKEVRERNYSFPQPEEGILVVCEPIATAYSRHRMRRIAGRSTRKTIVLESANECKYLARVMKNGTVLDVYRLRTRD